MQILIAIAIAAAAAATLVINKTIANILKQLKEEKARQLKQLEQNHLAANAKVKGNEITL
jgi:hypothetical protein